MLERGAVCKKTAGARSAGVGWSAGAAIKNRLERGAEGGAEVKKGRSAGALIPLDPPQIWSIQHDQSIDLHVFL